MKKLETKGTNISNCPPPISELQSMQMDERI